MGERTHRIRRQIVEVEIADEGDARPLQERLSRLHGQRIAAAIERACDAIAGSGATVRLDRVTVDLGEIAADELEEVLVERLRGRLEGTLRRVVQGEADGARAPGGGQGEARRVDDAQAALEELTSFARTGALPWWASDRGGDHLQRRAEALLAASPGALVRLLRGLVAAGERRSLARLVGVLDDRLLGELAARSLAPTSIRTFDRAGGPAEAAAEIAALLDGPEAVAERTPRARRNLAWRGLLEVVGRSAAGAAALPTAELYGMVIEAVAAIVGRPLPGAARRLRRRLQERVSGRVQGEEEPRFAAEEGEGREAAPPPRPMGDAARSGGDMAAGADASTRLAKETGATSRAGERVATRATEAAREVLRRAALRAAPSGADDTAEAQRPGALRGEQARAADAERRGEVLSSKVSSDRSSAAQEAPTRDAAEAVEAWVRAAEDAVAVVGAGPPGLEGRRRLDRLIAALVALAPRVAEWSEAERAPRLLAAVDPAASSRRGVEFSLMALVGGAASRLATAEVKALRGGLEALLERARTHERMAVEDPSRGASAASEAAADDTSHSVLADDASTPSAGATRDGQGERERGAAATGADEAVHSDMSRRDTAPESWSAERASEPTARSADARVPRASSATSARSRDAGAFAGEGAGARGLGDAAQAENVHARARRAVASRRAPEGRATDREPSRPAGSSSTPARRSPLAERPPVATAARARADARPTDPSRRRRSPPSLPSLADLRDDALYIDDAGMVLLWPFIPFFLRHLGLVEERSFVDAEAQLRAAALLRVAVSGEREIAEYQLPLAKVLCGLELDALFELDAPVGDEEEAEATAMIEAVIARAPILGRMSVAGLRGSFLLRPGALRVRDGAWLLQVERQSFDVVLDRFPWSSSWVKLPWMAEPVQVEW